jgi:hypothetical protein
MRKSELIPSEFRTVDWTHLRGKHSYFMTYSTRHVPTAVTKHWNDRKFLNGSLFAMCNDVMKLTLGENWDDWRPLWGKWFLCIS